MKDAIKKGIIVGLGVILQVLLSLFIHLFLVEKIWVIDILYGFLSLILVFGLIRNSKNYSYTLPWIIILILFPLVGTLLYFILAQNRNNSKIYKKIKALEKENKKYFKSSASIKPNSTGNIYYLSEFAGYPATTKNDVTYFSLGEEAFQSMLEELKKAKKFIFFEYFIVSHGTMWNSILEILLEKVKEGVDVRVMYDDAGCISTLKHNYDKFLESKGIKCVVFNKLNPISGVIMNHRDHRKILIIDGQVAFSGGINISDEYININSPFGHWKDNGIKVYGEAVWSYTILFLTMWNALRKTDDNYEQFKCQFKNIEENGYAIPYGENPLDQEITGEDVYLNIINQASKYVYIMTPYLIIDTDIINALVLAAKRGVDVRIVIPGVPDKKIVYTLSESYIEALVNGGVNVYKYTPGFTHAKVFVADDCVATVGTINLDYRSLYLHFECGLYLEKVKCIKDIKRDLDDTIKKSHKVTKMEATPSLGKGLWQALLRLIAPLL